MKENVPEGVTARRPGLTIANFVSTISFILVLSFRKEIKNKKKKELPVCLRVNPPSYFGELILIGRTGSGHYRVRERERDIVKKDSLRRKRGWFTVKEREREREIRERRRIRLRWRLWKCASSNKTTTENLRGWPLASHLPCLLEIGKKSCVVSCG